MKIEITSFFIQFVTQKLRIISKYYARLVNSNQFGKHLQTIVCVQKKIEKRPFPLFHDDRNNQFVLDFFFDPGQELVVITTKIEHNNIHQQSVTHLLNIHIK